MTRPDDPIYPCTSSCDPGMYVTYDGLEIRQYFAGLAMQGQIAHYGAANPESVAKMAVKAADALINELNKNDQSK